jgi:hypothetical protein
VLLLKKLSFGFQIGAIKDSRRDTGGRTRILEPHFSNCDMNSFHPAGYTARAKKHAKEQVQTARSYCTGRSNVENAALGLQIVLSHRKDSPF